MPIPSLAADLAYILQDVGVSVSYGSVTTYGKLRRTPIQGATDTGLERVGVDITLVLRDGVLADPLVDYAITVDGIAYVIRDTGDVLPDGTRHLTLAPWRIAYTGAAAVTMTSSVEGQGEESFSGAGALVQPGAGLVAAGAESFSGIGAIVQPGAGLLAAGTAEATPDILPGLEAWGEGSDLGADGTAIASWLNKTLSGIDPAQATGANKPTVKANAINGQKAVEFTAANTSYLAFPAGALAWLQNIPGATFACVFQPKTVGTAQENLLTAGINASASARLALFRPSGAGKKYAAFTRSNDSTSSTATGATTALVGVPLILVASMSPGTGTQTLLVNGASDATGVVSPTQSLPNTAAHDITIGANGTPGTPCDGYMAAYAIWTSAYTAAQLDLVLRRWARIYGITLP